MEMLPSPWPAGKGETLGAVMQNLEMVESQMSMASAEWGVGSDSCCALPCSYQLGSASMSLVNCCHV